MKPLDPILTVAVAPHVHCGRTISKTYRDILIALLPAAVAAALVFGVDALRVMALSCSAAVIAESLCWQIQGRDNAIDDFHALTIGLLFAFLLPASTPWWLVTAGSICSVVVGKMFFGGIGGYPLCPPLVGWAICRISWTPYMDTNSTMLNSSFAAPLHELKHFGLPYVQSLDPLAMLSGHQLGGLGAVQIFALLAGGIYLLAKQTVRPHIPLAFLGGVTVTALVFHLISPTVHAGPYIHLVAGSAVFGAFFLATDGPTSPLRPTGMIIYGLLAGAVVIIIRTYGIYPDGVPFAILIANLFTPMIDKFGPKPFGGPAIGTPYTGGF